MKYYCTYKGASIREIPGNGISVWTDRNGIVSHNLPSVNRAKRWIDEHPWRILTIEGYVFKEKKEELLKDFNRKYSWCTIEDGVVDKFLLKSGVKADVDLLIDYVLSNNLAEEVVE